MASLHRLFRFVWSDYSRILDTIPSTCPSGCSGLDHVRDGFWRMDDARTARNRCDWTDEGTGHEDRDDLECLVGWSTGGTGRFRT